MKKMFLAKDKPLHTCDKENCEHCDVPGYITCHFDKGKLIRFIFLMFPVFGTAVYQLISYNALSIIPWVVMIIGYFGFIEIRVMCSHCPHYAEPGLKSLKCWANYGSPKIWKYRPGPMSLTERIIFLSGMISIFVYPIPFFFMKAGTLSYILWGMYVALIIFGFSILKRKYCSFCMNFACPFNEVENEAREKFFEKNPIVKAAWKK